MRCRIHKIDIQAPPTCDLAPAWLATVRTLPHTVHGKNAKVSTAAISITQGDIRSEFREAWMIALCKR